LVPPTVVVGVVVVPVVPPLEVDGVLVFFGVGVLGVVDAFGFEDGLVLGLALELALGAGAGALAEG